MNATERRPQSFRPRRLLQGLGLAAIMAVPLLTAFPLRAEEPMPVPTPDAASLYEAHTLEHDDEGTAFSLPYRLLRPRATTEAARYPLVIFLHGAGERGEDNLAQLKYFPTWMAADEAREQYPCYVLAPQCRTGKWWVPFRRGDDEGEPLSKPPAADLAAVMTVIEQLLADEPIDADRVYLTGLSMGGFGSWDLAARMPERFAAMIPICGGGDPRLAKAYVDLPIWCFHGADDRVVPPDLSRSMIDAIKAAGGSPTYTEYEGVGHDSWTPAYRDPATLAWLFEQHR